MLFGSQGWRKSSGPPGWGWRVLLALALVVAGGARVSAGGGAQTVRIVCYNIEADTGGYTAPRPGLYTVLEAIGEGQNGGGAHPIDLLALEETTSNATTVAPIVSALNDYYGAGTYASVGYQATQRGNATTGNGPNAMIYNTQTMQVVAQNGA